MRAVNIQAAEKQGGNSAKDVTALWEVEQTASQSVMRTDRVYG